MNYYCKKLLYPFLLFVLFFSTSATGTSKKIRDLEFLSKRIVDIGNIVQGDTITKEFWYQNNSNKIITIKTVKKSCTCTDYTIDKFILKPQEKGVITIKIDTQGKIGRNNANVNFVTESDKNYNYIISLYYTALPKK